MPGWAEQDAADWERAIWESTRRLIAQAGISPGDVAAVSFSGTMTGALLVDRQGVPLGRSIIWADQRATAEADFIGSACGAEAIYRLTGQRLSPTYTAPKVMWIKDHLPAAYARAWKVLQAKDYAAFLLTGVFATDYSDASSTLLFDLTRRRWVPELIAALGLNGDLLPDVLASTAIVGRVTPRGRRPSAAWWPARRSSWAAATAPAPRWAPVRCGKGRPMPIWARLPGLPSPPGSPSLTRNSAPSR